MSGEQVLVVTDDFLGRANVATYDDWRTAYSAAWNNQLIPASVNRSAPREFSGWIESRRVRDLQLIRSESMPFAGHCGATFPDYVGIQIATMYGGESVQFRGSDVPHIMTSTANVWDGGELQSFQMLGPGESFSVLVPRAAIQQRVGPRFALKSPTIQSDGAPLRLLESLAVSLSHEFPTMQTWEFDSARNALIDLIAGLAREVDDESSAAVSDVMLRTVSLWIDEHLLDGQITSERAAYEHGISIRSLHRLFERQGKSFSAVVRSKRLYCALEDLAATNLSITYLASKWGYADTSHYCREIKRTHGMTPSEYRRASQVAPAHAEYDSQSA